MKYGKLIQIAATTSAVLGTILASGTLLAAQGNTPKHSHYRVVDPERLAGHPAHTILAASSSTVGELL